MIKHCPTCTENLDTARVVCRGCGEPLPLRIVLISEGSRGGGFALVEEVSTTGDEQTHDEVHERATDSNQEESL